MAPETSGALRPPAGSHRRDRSVRMVVLQLLHPAEAARQITGSTHWIGAGLFLICGHLVISSLLLPLSIRATTSSLPASVTAQGREVVSAMLEQEHIVRSAFLPIRLGAGWALFAAWVWLLCKAMSYRTVPRYRRVLSIVVSAELFGVLARAGTLVRSTWLSSGDAARDLLPPLSAADFLSASADHVLSAACSAVNPFSAMYVVALALGVRVSCDFGPWKSALVALIAWCAGSACNVGLLWGSRVLLHGAL